MTDDSNDLVELTRVESINNSGVELAVYADPVGDGFYVRVEHDGEHHGCRIDGADALMKVAVALMTGEQR